jgi:hypothetical protein
VTRKFVILAASLLLAGCAARTQAPRLAPGVPIPSAPRRQAEPPGYTGVTLDALRARLGGPAFSRKDGATEMWRYDAGACHAFFFFTGGAVNHIETVPRGPGDAAADPACLNALSVKKKP